MKKFLTKAKRFVFRKLYYGVGIHLPDSDTSKLSMKIRAWLTKGFILSCGFNVNIEHGAKFDSDLSIGDNSGVGIDCRLGGGITIGDNVMMGPECIMLPHFHRNSRLDIPMCEQGFEEAKPIHIRNDIWIGTRVIIMPGVTVGDHSIIGAGAVVTKDVPEYAVVGGCPARILKMRNAEEV